MRQVDYTYDVARMRDVLRDALTATGDKESPGKIELLCENDEFYRTFPLNYTGGRRYPRLERDEGKPDLLTSILKPLTPSGK